jgi:hypothetical protein
MPDKGSEPVVAPSPKTTLEKHQNERGTANPPSFHPFMRAQLKGTLLVKNGESFHLLRAPEWMRILRVFGTALF